ncbi:gibberellin 20-oxidase 3, ARABIDOPSIS THALIANA GIBBERELLIN 20-OXIDASE 3 [Hibiscus trionum]|uniref:Gibberellin 20-oxidase 3, ARABIDOPSIS THALIANA GIBBERELLIN 20-OXIDASE 3 n=1 Tax=Hibiscus trionum TaxID=183268 RepID=A0A9W7LYT1_HIBTR|nr:gibberellin 20-oxidase 3, ARABIDOPSIS THALIANA GIBBERELLIN 20-OXIDASE 3 [Hibiscus trionum]
MDSAASASKHLLASQLEIEDQTQDNSCVDSCFLQNQTSIPKQFRWPKVDLVHAQQELLEPLVDLERFFRGDELAIQQAAEVIRAACLTHGFFQVINHGVDSQLINAAYYHLNRFFKLPLTKKLRARKTTGAGLTTLSYSGAHSDRFSSNLPWKETLTFPFKESTVVDLFKSSLGDDFEKMGITYQKYCEEMKSLALSVMEILAISLGVDRLHYKKYFEDGEPIVRCNYYPPCPEPGLTFGTGPHCDTTSLTILHQDEVGGLEIFANNKWQIVRPRHDALVINIGETFTALTNGEYKSCVHRAVVNSERARASVAFFVCPRKDKVVKPPQDLVRGGRAYPDFTWSDFLRFTQLYYRADVHTLHNFTKWLSPSKPILHNH